MILRNFDKDSILLSRRCDIASVATPSQTFMHGRVLLSYPAIQLDHCLMTGLVILLALPEPLSLHRW